MTEEEDERVGQGQVGQWLRNMLTSNSALVTINELVREEGGAEEDSASATLP